MSRNPDRASYFVKQRIPSESISISILMLYAHRVAKKKTKKKIENLFLITINKTLRRNLERLLIVA
jgi:hypothetical protein